MGERVKARPSEKTRVDADAETRKLVVNSGASVYYGDQSVSPTVNDGTLTAGQSTTLSQTRFFLTAGSNGNHSVLSVSDVAADAADLGGLDARLDDAEASLESVERGRTVAAAATGVAATDFAELQARLDTGDDVVIVGSATDYKINTAELVVSTAGQRVSGIGFPTIEQVTTGRGVFDITADNVVVEGIFANSTQTKTYDNVGGNAGTFRGENAWARDSGFLVIADGVTIRNCKARNFQNGVNVSGWNGTDLSTIRVNDVTVDNLEIEDVWAGVIANSTERLTVRRVHGTYKQMTDSPHLPHCVYMLQAAGSTGVHYGPTLSDCSAKMSTPLTGSTGYSFKGCRGGSAVNMAAYQCGGLVTLDTATEDFYFQGVSLDDRATDGASVKFAATAYRNRVKAHVQFPVKDTAAGTLIDGTDNVVEMSVAMEAATATDGNYVFRIAGNRNELRFPEVYNSGTATGIPGITITAGDRHRVFRPKMTNVRSGVLISSGVTKARVDLIRSQCQLYSGSPAPFWTDAGTDTEVRGLALGRQNGYMVPSALLGCGLAYAGSQNTIIAGRLYGAKFVPSETFTATKIGFRVATADTVDNNMVAGILDSAGTRLATSGLTAGKVNSTGAKSVSMTASLRLNEGQIYYAVFLVPTITTSVAVTQADFQNANGPAMFGTAMGSVDVGALVGQTDIPASGVVLSVVSVTPLLTLLES